MPTELYFLATMYMHRTVIKVFSIDAENNKNVSSMMIVDPSLADGMIPCC